MQPALRIFETNKFIFDQKSCGSRKGDRGDLKHGMCSGALNKQKRNGQNGDGKINVQACAVPFGIDEIPQKCACNTYGEACKYVGRIVHSEVQAREHDQKHEQGAQNDDERLADADGKRGEKAARRGGVAAGKTHVGIEVSGRHNDIVYIYFIHRSGDEGTKPAHGAFYAGGNAASGHDRNESLFSDAFGKTDVNDGDDGRDDEFFAECRKDRKEYVQERTANFFESL